MQPPDQELKSGSYLHLGARVSSGFDETVGGKNDRAMRTSAIYLLAGTQEGGSLVRDSRIC